MNRVNKILGAVLIAQVALVALTWSLYYTSPAASGSEPLFGFEAKKVTALEITAKPAKPEEPVQVTKLAKKDDKWVLVDADDYPAEKEKVEKLVEDLTSLRIRDPIARNAANHNALKVGEQEYDRRVTLKTSSDSKTVIVGSGKGSSLNVRYQGKNEVYRTQGMSVWSISTGKRAYVDSEYFKVDKDKITAATLRNEKGILNFAKQGVEWTVLELPPGETLDKNKMKNFIDRLSKIHLNEPIGKEVKPEYGLSGRTEVVLVTADEDETETHRYVIGDMKGDQYYYAKADDNEYVVTISKWDANELREKHISDLLEKKKTEEPASAPSSSAAPASAPEIIRGPGSGN
jgi:hypothetical protein